MKMGEILSLGEARPGMRLAVAVADRSGQVLLPAGTELTESLLQALSRREIDELGIEREAAEEDPAAHAARIAAVRVGVDRLFRAAGSAPATATLYQCIVDYRIELRR